MKKAKLQTAPHEPKKLWTVLCGFMASPFAAAPGPPPAVVCDNHRRMLCWYFAWTWPPPPLLTPALHAIMHTTTNEKAAMHG